jgi:hypothetical protein
MMNKRLIRRALMTMVVPVLALASCTKDQAPDGRETGVAPSSRRSETSGTPGDEFTRIAGDDEGNSALSAGEYGLGADGDPSAPLAVVEVDEPDAFHGFRGFSISSEEDPFRGISYHAVDGVFRDACARTDPLDVGTSVDDLVAALRRQDMTRTSRPRPITLDGHAGVYVELTASPRIRLEDCQDGQFEVWNAMGDAHWWLFEPGQVDRLWVLDVDGHRVVLDARSVPGVAAGPVQTTVRMVESVQFVEQE